MAECVGETSHNTEGIPGSKRSEMVDDPLPADFNIYTNNRQDYQNLHAVWQQSSYKHSVRYI